MKRLTMTEVFTRRDAEAWCIDDGDEHPVLETLADATAHLLGHEGALVVLHRRIKPDDPLLLAGDLAEHIEDLVAEAEPLDRWSSLATLDVEGHPTWRKTDEVDAALQALGRALVASAPAVNGWHEEAGNVEVTYRLLAWARAPEGTTLEGMLAMEDRFHAVMDATTDEDTES